MAEHSPQTLRFAGPGLERLELAVTFGEDRAPQPGSPFRLRTVRLAEPWPGVEPGGVTELLQKRIVDGGRAEWAHLDGLDREISIGLRLLRGSAAAGREYPRELTRLIGYDVDALEPFVLYLPYHGTPVARQVRRFLLPDQQALESGLFQALERLASLGVTHRAISPDTVLWEQGTSRVQLVDFSSAVVSGSAAGAAAGTPWLCPADVHSGDTRVDVWSAGAVLYYAITGRRPADRDPASDAAMRSSTLQSQLARILADSVAARPDAREVLLALGRHETWPDLTALIDAPDAEFERGGAEFDGIFPPPVPVAPPQPPPVAPIPVPPPGPDSGRKRRWPWSKGAPLR